jgi:hypothetical protein
LSKLRERKRFRIGPLGPHLRTTFGDEAQAFLRRKGIHLVGERLESFLKAYVEAKEFASQTLMNNANRDYTPDTKIAERYPKYEPPNPARQFDVLWKEFCTARAISASTLKKWEPYFAQLRRRVGSDDMSRVTEQHLLDWRDALLATKLSPATVRDGYIAAARVAVRLEGGDQHPIEGKRGEYNQSNHRGIKRG